MCTCNSAFLSFLLPSFFILIALFPFISKLPLRSLLIYFGYTTEWTWSALYVCGHFLLLARLVAFWLLTSLSSSNFVPLFSSLSKFFAPFSLSYQQFSNISLVSTASQFANTELGFFRPAWCKWREKMEWSCWDTSEREQKSWGWSTDKLDCVFFFFQFYGSFSVAEKTEQKLKIAFAHLGVLFPLGEITDVITNSRFCYI